MIFISSSFRSREERRGLVLKLKPGEAREARWMMRMAFSESAPKMEEKGGKKIKTHSQMGGLWLF